MILTSVDLPAPLSPISPSTSPRSSSRSTPCSAWIAPKCLEMPAEAQDRRHLTPSAARPRTGRRPPPAPGSRPITICWMNGETLSSTSPLLSTPISSAPTTVPKTPPDAAEERGPPDHHRRDHVELEPQPGHRLGRVQPRREQERREPAEEADDDVDREHHPPRVDAVERPPPARCRRPHRRAARSACAAAPRARSPPRRRR